MERVPKLTLHPRVDEHSYGLFRTTGHITHDGVQNFRWPSRFNLSKLTKMAKGRLTRSKRSSLQDYV